MGRIANMLNSKQLTTIPRDTKRNLREHVKVVALRSGKELNDLIVKKKNDEEKKAQKGNRRWKCRNLKKIR